MTGALTWYVSRASGLVAWALLAVALVWGVLLSSRLLGRRPSPAWLLDLHRHLGALALVLTGIHVGAIWIDEFVEYTSVEILVPFTSDLDRLAVGLGTLALWNLVLVQSTSWQRHRLPAELWRRLHLLSVPLVAVAGLHAWLVGTDIANPVAAVVGAVLVAEVVLVLGLRLRYGRRRPAPSGI